ncbi:MAG: 50S ribosomal protein L21 [Acidobacteriota bacterium]|nr:50S ribosomal protein L21 [Acidobacteriota bacterium]
MFAVIKTGGKQYRVQEGDILQVEKLNKEESQEVTFNQVLLIEDEEKTLIGTPYIEKALVRAVVIENFKDKKIIVFKKKRRKQYRKTKGHRQELTKIKIEQIITGEKEKEIEAETPKKKATAKSPKEKIVAKKDATRVTKSKAPKEKAPAKKQVKKKTTQTKKPKLAKESKNGA